MPPFKIHPLLGLRDKGFNLLFSYLVLYSDVDMRLLNSLSKYLAHLSQ